MSGDSPCLTCGACCAALSVGFSADETSRRGGSVPTALTDPWIPGHVRMRGTSRAPRRCVALDGRVGEGTRCTIYERRPSPCADLAPGSAWCAEARAAHRLPPLPEPG